MKQCIRLTKALAAASLLVCSAGLPGQPRTATLTPANGIAQPIDASQSIITFEHRLASGDRQALDEFWSEAERIGTPLVEPSKNQTDEVIVTFVWRGDTRTQNVALQAPLANSPGMPTLQLYKLPDTDVWYRCWRMRGDLRFTCRFLVDVKPGPVTLDNLTHAGMIPPMVAIFIGNVRDSRSTELGNNPALVEFLTKELLPWVHDHWHVTRDPRKSIVGGYSFGGLAAAFVALRRPDLFGNVLSQSGAFWRGNDKDVKWEWLIGQYQTAPKRPLRFFVEAGLLEDVSRDGPTLLAANRHLVTVLKRKGYAVAYQEVGGTHEPVHWRGKFAEGLISLTK